MKVNELMIGDIVRRKKDGVTLHVEEIIYSGMLMAICPTDVYYSDAKDYNEDEVEPIPLTPEILEKIGFTNEGFFAKLEIDIRRIFCDSKNISILTGEHVDLAIPCFYVHELQHALRLCGINKEIEL